MATLGLENLLETEKKGTKGAVKKGGEDNDMKNFIDNEEEDENDYVGNLQ